MHWSASAFPTFGMVIFSAILAAVIVGGIAWFWLRGRVQTATPSGRTRDVAPVEADLPVAIAAVAVGDL